LYFLSGASLRYLASQYLADSSLSEEVSQFDFSTPIQVSKRNLSSRVLPMPENRLSRFKHRQQNGGMCLWCYYEGISTPGKMKNVPDHKHIVHLSTSHKQSKWWKTNKFASCCIVVLLVSADENDQNALIAVMFLLSLVYHIQALSQSESTDQDKIVDENTGPHEVKFFLQDSVAQLLPLRSCVRFSRCQLM
jgi:hypothetical protein